MRLKSIQKRYPELDLSWFNFANNKVEISPKGSPYAGQEFRVYGIKNKISVLKKKKILKLNEYDRFTTRFTRKECELFYNELLSVCGYLLFPCWVCKKHYQLKDLYIDKYGYHEKQTIVKQLCISKVSRCKRCADREVKRFNAPRPYVPKIIDKGGTWKGSYKVSDNYGWRD